MYATENKGVIGYRRHIDQKVVAPGNNDELRTESAFIWDDAAFVKMRFLQITDGGKPLDQAALDKQTGSSNAAWASGKASVLEPFQPGRLNDYDYALAPSSVACPPASAAIQFKSRIRDQNHGDGTMCIDNTDHHVLSVVMAPSVLPQSVDSGTVTESFGEVLPGVWHAVQIQLHYSAHFLQAHGTTDATEVLDGFQRFQSVSNGLSFLASP